MSPIAKEIFQDKHVLQANSRYSMTFEQKTLLSKRRGSSVLINHLCYPIAFLFPFEGRFKPKEKHGRKDVDSGCLT